MRRYEIETHVCVNLTLYGTVEAENEDEARVKAEEDVTSGRSNALMASMVSELYPDYIQPDEIEVVIVE